MRGWSPSSPLANHRGNSAGQAIGRRLARGFSLLGLLVLVPAVQAIDRQQFYETRNLIYDMLGWDRQSAAPKRWKLYELGLDWLVEDLEKQEIFIE